MIFSLPITGAYGVVTGSSKLGDANTATYTGMLHIGTDTCYVRYIATNGAYATEGYTSSTLPFTWTTGDSAVATASYLI